MRDCRQPIGSESRSCWASLRSTRVRSASQRAIRNHPPRENSAIASDAEPLDFVSMSTEIALKRIHDPPDPGDGLRILVDRLWPRGVKKEKAAVDIWAKKVAPSTELRQWFHSDVGDWREFRKRYNAELAANPEAVADIAKLASMQRLTFLYAAKDAKQNHAAVLRDYILKHADATAG